MVFLIFNADSRFDCFMVVLLCNFSLNEKFTLIEA